MFSHVSSRVQGKESSLAGNSCSPWTTILEHTRAAVVHVQTNTTCITYYHSTSSINLNKPIEMAFLFHPQLVYQPIEKQTLTNVVVTCKLFLFHPQSGYRSIKKQTLTNVVFMCKRAIDFKGLVFYIRRVATFF